MLGRMGRALTGRSQGALRALPSAVRGLAVVAALQPKDSAKGRTIAALLASAKLTTHSFPAWLRTELRTDHAGEFGAVEIYRGALLGAELRERGVSAGEETQRMKAFCLHHMQTEQAHLDVMLELVPETNRTKLQGVWFLAGACRDLRASSLSGVVACRKEPDHSNVAARTLGFFPALLGPRALYWTIASVETFVEEHYQCQVPASPHQTIACFCALTGGRERVFRKAC